MEIETILNTKIIKSKAYCYYYPITTFILVELALYFSFCLAPEEVIMGAVQKIFYFHVAAAFTSYLLIALLLFASVFYLVSKKDIWDIVAESANNTAFVFCSIVLITGMIWGHSAWNTWWRWEPRLVSSLALWLILFVYMLLRMFTEDNPRQKNFAAVLAIISALFVPIVIFSIKIMNQSEQLHPQVVGRQGLGDPFYKYALLISSIALIVLGFHWCLLRIVNKLLELESIELLRNYNIKNLAQTNTQQGVLNYGNNS